MSTEPTPTTEPFRAPVVPQVVRPLAETATDAPEDNSEAARVLGKRAEDVDTDGVLVINFPGEEGYRCPVCVYPHPEQDERLTWSEYRTMLWCYVCERDYPSALCLPDDIGQAITVYLWGVEQVAAVRAGALSRLLRGMARRTAILRGKLLDEYLPDRRATLAESTQERPDAPTVGVSAPANHQVESARVRIVADVVRKLMAHRLGVTGMRPFDTAGDREWLLAVGRGVLAALDGADAEVVRREPVEPDRTTSPDDVDDLLQWLHERSEQGGADGSVCSQVLTVIHGLRDELDQADAFGRGEFRVTQWAYDQALRVMREAQADAAKTAAAHALCDSHARTIVALLDDPQVCDPGPRYRASIEALRSALASSAPVPAHPGVARLLARCDELTRRNRASGGAGLDVLTVSAVRALLADGDPT